MKQSQPTELDRQQNNRSHFSASNVSFVGQAFVDNRGSTAIQRQLMAKMVSSPQALAQRKFSEQIHNSPRMTAQRQRIAMMSGDAVQRVEGEEELLQGKFNPVQRVEEEELMQGKFGTAQRVEEEEPLQGKFDTVQRVEEEELMQGKFDTAQLAQAPAEKANNTGLPDNLKQGIENLSGMSMDNVKVHYNSPKPAQLNALAYAQGTDIHVGAGQEKHLPHEAWHVVQQAQGRVKPTMQMREGVPVNDDQALEHEADVMGGRAISVEVMQARHEVNSIESDPNGLKDSSLAVPVQKTIQRILNKDFAPITTQVALNAALLLLNPPVRGMIPAQYQARGATLQMLDAAIAASNLYLYDGMSRGELLRELRPLIDHQVTNTVANYAYDPHGDKHFPGGSPGTKFNGYKDAVNPQLVALISAQIARIRRDAKGNNQSYYFTLEAIAECGDDDLTIQVDYAYVGDTVTYHGYPDNGVVAYSLSRVKNGAGIP